MSVLVVRLNPHTAKNVPQRNRVGYKFLHSPTAALLTEEEEAVVRADAYLKVCNFPSVAWFEGMGIERTQVNEDKFKDKDGNFIPPTELPESAVLAIKVTPKEEQAQKATQKPAKAPTPPSEGGDANQQANNAPAPTGDATGGTENGDGTVQSKGLFGKTVELSASSSKEDLIAALVRKRKVEGKDFNKDATPEALFKLLRSL